MKPKLFLLLILVIGIWSFESSPALSQHFESTNYTIDWGNFNITSGRKTSTTYRLTDTVGQNAPGQYDSSGFIVKSGFQYIHDLLNIFSFSIDNLDIAFGTLVPNIGTTLTSTLTITTPNGRGYEIYAAENHPLTIYSGATIPDTTGDHGTCSESQSDTWNNASTSGFGLNVLGAGTSSYFTDSSQFRQFANLASGESPQIIMSEDDSVKNHSATVSYKVNISSSQDAGNYENSIIFTAIPKY